jgi:hypothetical protein
MTEGRGSKKQKIGYLLVTATGGEAVATGLGVDGEYLQALMVNRTASLYSSRRSLSPSPDPNQQCHSLPRAQLKTQKVHSSCVRRGDEGWSSRRGGAVGTGGVGAGGAHGQRQWWKDVRRRSPRSFRPRGA